VSPTLKVTAEAAVTVGVAAVTVGAAEAEVAVPAVRVAPEAVTAAAAAETPAVAVAPPLGVASPRGVTTGAGIVVKKPLRHSVIETATGIATETATEIGNTLSTARTAWGTAIVAEAWGSPCRMLPIERKTRRARAVHRSGLR
jgi:adenosylcobinamide amidohydrolase